jgi:hypothetical protein
LTAPFISVSKLPSSNMSAFTSTTNYPTPSQSSLLSQYVGQHIRDLPTPAVILDRSKIKKHCAAMLSVCSALGVGFRPHIKTHKTLELAKLQVGEEGPANFIVSTVVEAEGLSGFVGECQRGGREGSVSEFSYTILHIHYLRRRGRRMCWINNI